MKTLAVILLTTLVFGASLSQTFTEAGMMSGSGLILTPTNIVSPKAQFRLNVGRIGRADDAGRGFNVMTIGLGFSPIFEAYARFTGEQAGNAQSQGVIGFGGKIMFPFQVPLLRVVSLWGESSTTEMDDRGVLFSPRTTRAAILNTPLWSTVFRPTLIVGGVRYDGLKARLMLGGNLVISPTNTTQIGLEYIHGYTGRGGDHAMVSGIFRVLPNVSVQAGPGYVSSPTATGWLWSFGISIGTADFDFQPAPVVKKEDYVLPTIDELLNPAAESPSNPDDSEKPDQKEEHQ